MHEQTRIFAIQLIQLCQPLTRGDFWPLSCAYSCMHARTMFHARLGRACARARACVVIIQTTYDKNTL